MRLLIASPKTRSSHSMKFADALTSLGLKSICTRSSERATRKSESVPLIYAFL